MLQERLGRLPDEMASIITKHDSLRDIRKMRLPSGHFEHFVLEERDQIYSSAVVL